MTSGSRPAGPQGRRAVVWYPTGLGPLGFESGARTSRPQAQLGALPPSIFYPPVTDSIPSACPQHGVWVYRDAASWGRVVDLEDSSHGLCCFRNCYAIVLSPRSHGSASLQMKTDPHVNPREVGCMLFPGSEAPSEVNSTQSSGLLLAA